MTSSVSRWGAGVFIAGLLALMVSFTASASAAEATSVVMLSDSGDYIGGGESRFFHPGNGSVTVGGNAGFMTVSVSGGTRGDSFSLNFAAPPGQSLSPGVYERAQRAVFREAGRPGIDVSGAGRGCNTIGGRFEIKDFATNAAGAVTRAWIVYEQHCEGGTPALFGEVRIGVPIPDGPTDPAPSILRWPGIDVGRGGTVVPVTVLATSGTKLTSASVVGADAGAFPIRLDECSGVTLVAGASCQVWMRFSPSSAGDHTATLRIANAGGGFDEVQLAGFAYGGSTRVNMDSDTGDYIGGGQQWRYSPANARIEATGTRRHVSFSVTGADGSWWSADFAAPQSDILAPGTYAGAKRYPFQGTGAGLDVSGNGRGCNALTGQFTVTDASFETDGSLRTFGVALEQHCEGGAPALRGVFEYRAGWTGPPPGPTPNPGPGGDPGPNPDPGPSPPTQPGGSGQPALFTVSPPPTVQAGVSSGPCKRAQFARAKVLRGTARPDRIVGGAAGEVFLAGRGNDRVTARGGGDCVDGGPGGDVLNGGPGSDRISGGPGDDRLIGGNGHDVLDCGSGQDVADASRGDRVRGCERVIRRNRG